jgi:[ribosomal protein S5]-alanine N-acetyltransferase
MSYFLETSRIGFKTWTENDFVLAKNLWGNPQVLQHISAQTKLSDSEIQEKLNTEIANIKRFGVQYWPCFLKEHDLFIGVCGLKPYKLFDGIFEMSVQFLPEFWHQGLAFEASSAMIDHAFSTLNISSLFAGHNPQSPASGILLKKLGFRFTHFEYYPPTGLNHHSYILNKDERLYEL